MSLHKRPCSANEKVACEDTSNGGENKSDRRCHVFTNDLAVQMKKTLVRKQTTAKKNFFLNDFAPKYFTMVLLLDNFDSYTYNLYDYLLQIGLQVDVKRNHLPLAEYFQKNYTAVVFSPGPSRPKDAGVMNELIRHFHTRIPLLGICLGHQAIGEFFGAELVKHRPHHGKISFLRLHEDAVFQHISLPFQAVRYHSLVLQNLPPELKCIAESEDGNIMAVKHRELPIYGFQFHPEAVMSTQGLALLRNWKNCVLEKKPD